MTMAIPMTMTYDELRSELGDTQLHIGELYHEKEDYKAAASWFKASAGNGNAAAYRSYANMLYDGQGVEKNLSEAFMWYSESAKLGNSDANFQLAYILLHDYSGSWADINGSILMKSSAALGCSKAINYLHSKKNTLPYDFKKHPMTLRSHAVKC